LNKILLIIISTALYICLDIYINIYPDFVNIEASTKCNSFYSYYSLLPQGPGETRAA